MAQVTITIIADSNDVSPNDDGDGIFCYPALDVVKSLEATMPYIFDNVVVLSEVSDD